MLGEIYLWLRYLGPVCLFFAIALDFLNYGDIKRWLRSYSFLLLFGFYNFTVVALYFPFWAVLPVNFLILSCFLIFNWNKPGLNFSIMGALSNIFVMLANGGKMPMPLGWAEEDFQYQFINSKTHFIFLSDWIRAGDFIVSPGDFALYLGAILFFLWQIYLFLKNRRKAVKN